VLDVELDERRRFYAAKDGIAICTAEKRMCCSEKVTNE
jgi:hypothetical protein